MGSIDDIMNVVTGFFMEILAAVNSLPEMQTNPQAMNLKLECNKFGKMTV